MNKWTGLCKNADGTRTFLDGYPVEGVNKWFQTGQSLYQDDTNDEGVIGFSDYISKKNSYSMSPLERFERGEENEDMTTYA